MKKIYKSFGKTPKEAVANLWDLMQYTDDYCVDHCVFREVAYDYYKKCAKELMDLARTQIASKINPELMCATVMLGMGHLEQKAYCRGIEDVLKKIKDS